MRFVYMGCIRRRWAVRKRSSLVERARANTSRLCLLYRRHEQDFPLLRKRQLSLLLNHGKCVLNAAVFILHTSHREFQQQKRHILSRYEKYSIFLLAHRIIICSWFAMFAGDDKPSAPLQTALHIGCRRLSARIKTRAGEKEREQEKRVAIRRREVRAVGRKNNNERISREICIVAWVRYLFFFVHCRCLNKPVITCHTRSSHSFLFQYKTYIEQSVY